MLNLGNPVVALRWWRLPADGIGFARMEFVVSDHIKNHPMALAYFDSLKDETARNTILALTAGYSDKTQYFVDRLALGLSRIAASAHPNPVIVRMSDFKSNEYSGCRVRTKRGKSNARATRRVAILLAPLSRRV